MALTVQGSKLAAVSAVIGAAGVAVAGLLLAIDNPWAVAAFGLGLAALGVAIALDRARVRSFFRGRQARFGGNALVLGASFVGTLVAVNLIAINFPQRIDLTEDKTHSLRPETLLLLSELEQPVTIRGFYSPDRARARDQMRPILDQYASESDGLVSYEFIDPNANPLAADSFGYRGDAWMGLTVGEATHVVAYPSEREITSAIVRLSNPENRTVYFLTGHGEHELRSSSEAGMAQVVQALEFKNYGVETLNLRFEAELPADAVALISAGPETAFTEGELELIDGFLTSGGALVALLEPSPVSELEPDADSLGVYLRDVWGLHARDDYVIDPSSFYADVAQSYLYGEHAITERIANFTTHFPSARSLGIIELPDRAAVELVSSSVNSWGETDFAELIAGSTSHSEQEALGPLALAAAAEDVATGGRVVVVGDSDFATNGSIFAGANGDLILNSVDWAAKLDSLIDISPREQTRRQVVPATPSTVLMLSALAVVVMPGLILLAGGWVWWSRRRHP